MNLLPFMKRWQMLPPAGGVVLCAVSGGRDSMCLLHYLHAISADCGFSVAAGHFNHRMRPEADSDEAFVRAFCEERNIPFYTEKAPVYEKAQEWKLSVEETVKETRKVLFEGKGFLDTKIYLRNKMGPGMKVEGPAIIEEVSSACLIYPGMTAEIDDYSNVIIDVGETADE